MDSLFLFYSSVLCGYLTTRLFIMVVMKALGNINILLLDVVHHFMFVYIRSLGSYSRECRQSSETRNGLNVAESGSVRKG